mmetsp:Transcript_2837/g.7097  ORF Transcript_2837/g.7097 Transcript_2837/m.7097 type:complete len:225 (-) Transcript_2837:551-1225(-)
MPLDLLGALLAEPLLAVAQQRADEALGVRGERRLRRELQGLLEAEDLAARDQRVVAVKGRVADEHLVDDDAERPPVAVLVVPDLEEDLRCHVVGRAHRRPDRGLAVAVPRRHALPSAHALPAALRPLRRHLLERRAAVRAVAATRVDERARAAGRVELELGVRERLDQPKVGELDVALQVEEQVVRLEVAVDVAARVQRVDREDGLRGVEARLLLGEHVALHEQ